MVKQTVQSVIKMKYKHLKRLALFQDWQPEINRALYYCTIMWPLQIIKQNGEKEMTVFEYRIEVPSLKFDLTENKKKKLIKAGLEKGWKELSLSLKRRKIKLVNRFDNEVRWVKGFKDINTFNKIPDAYKDIIHFYYEMPNMQQ